jgi:hypothetical protein
LDSNGLPDPTRPTCRGYDWVHGHRAYVGGTDVFCDPCIGGYERDIRMLRYHYLDLAQLQYPSLSQAMDTQTRGRGGPPMPMAGNPEALQAEIHHAVTLWADELRTRLGLSQPRPTVIVGAWHTTKTNPPPKPQPKPGAELEQALTILTPRLRLLARIPPTAVFPTGCDDTPQDMTGVDAVLHLSKLHQRARSMLGRTQRSTKVPGSCSDCFGELRRDEPRYEQDPCPIYCAQCGTTWTKDAYDRFVGLELAITRRNGRDTA